MICSQACEEAHEAPREAKQAGAERDEDQIAHFSAAQYELLE